MLNYATPGNREEPAHHPYSSHRSVPVRPGTGCFLFDQPCLQKRAHFIYVWGTARTARAPPAALPVRPQSARQRARPQSARVHRPMQEDLGTSDGHADGYPDNHSHWRTSSAAGEVRRGGPFNERARAGWEVEEVPERPENPHVSKDDDFDESIRPANPFGAHPVYSTPKWLRRFDTLAEMLCSITVDLKHDELARRTARVAGTLTGARCARVYWHDDERHVLKDSAEGRTFSTQRGIVGLVARTRQPIHSPVARKHRRSDVEVGWPT